METHKKLAILADAAKYDASCSSSGGKRKRPENGLGNAEGMGICHSYAPDGRCISLLKILLTNYCIYDCQYCINRISSDVPRARFTPAEVVELTLDFYRRNYIEGLFLSSGIIGSPDETMELVIQVAKSLRQDHKFGGYIHLKTVAGATQALIDEAGKWADRLSVNIELPTSADLQNLAPAKTAASIETSMGRIADKNTEAKEERKKSRKAPVFAPAGQTTQMIVGATDSPDAAIITTASRLYNKFSLRRVYYSAYSPIPKAHPHLPAFSPPLVREHRLYQADWLLRFYDFRASELFEQRQNLSLTQDPKLSWALDHREFFPVDVNTAPRASLLRVPGLGVHNVSRILEIRRHHRLRLDDLARLRVSMNKAKYFLIAADSNPSLRVLGAEGVPAQLSGTSSTSRLSALFTPTQLPLF